MDGSGVEGVRAPGTVAGSGATLWGVPSGDCDGIWMDRNDDRRLRALGAKGDVCGSDSKDGRRLLTAGGPLPAAPPPASASTAPLSPLRRRSFRPDSWPSDRGSNARTANDVRPTKLLRRASYASNWISSS